MIKVRLAGVGSNVLSKGEATNSAQITLERVLSHGSVPTLPAVALRLLEMTSNPDVSLNQIANLIQSDPGLASKVLKTVNSSFYGLSKPCPSIERAIALLGLKAVKSLVLGFSMINLTHGMDQKIDLYTFWKHTIISAVGARQIAQISGFGEPEEVFAASLFQDIGVLAMLAAFTEQYGKVVAETKGSHHKLLKIEREQLGLDHIQVGAALSEKWKLPEVITAGIRHHHDKIPPNDGFKALIQCIVIGELIASAMTTQMIGQEYAMLYSTANAWFGQGEEDIETLLNQVEEASREVAKLMEQHIGELPTAQELMARASEQLFQQQLETQREAERARKDAITDGLTGVPNRKHFDRLVCNALADAVAGKKSISVLFSDADKFKFVNDTYGHPCGDAVLVELARRVTEAVGERGTVCRYGGEEFVIVLPGLGMEQAAEVGEEVRRKIADTPFDLNGVPGAPIEPLPRTVSVGVASWSPGETQLSAEQLVQRADKAVYTAKESGRNNVKRWGIDTGRRESDQRSDQAAALGITLDAVPANGTTKVLLIEDDPLAARLIRSMLEQNKGVSVEIKTDGRQAIEYLRDCQSPGSRNPDLIISDMNIPGYNGLQIIRALRSNVRFQSIPIVVVSASLEESQRQACIDAGVDQIYNKLEISADLKSWCSNLIRSLKAAA